MKTRLILTAVISTLALAFSACSSSPSSSIVGTWKGTNLSTSGPGTVDAVITMDQTTYEALIYASGTTTLQSGSNRGTYTYAGDTASFTVSQEYDGAVWQSVTSTGTNHIVVNGNSLMLDQDWNKDGVVDTTWSLTRQ